MRKNRRLAVKKGLAVFMSLVLSMPPYLAYAEESSGADQLDSEPTAQQVVIVDGQVVEGEVGDDVVIGDSQNQADEVVAEPEKGDVSANEQSDGREDGLLLTAQADELTFIDENGEPQTITEYTEISALSADDTTLSTGWYAVTSSRAFERRLAVQGDVSILLCGSNTLDLGRGINVPPSSSLTIYADSINGDGKLIAICYGGNACIGGDEGASGGTITINGGIVKATSNGSGAAIGGGANGDNGTVTINGGDVTAKTEQVSGGAGIGGGANGNYSDGASASSCGSGGIININGGTVTAFGGEGAAGIGGGEKGEGPTLTITGGTITATGGSGGAGIGNGSGLIDHGDGTFDHVSFTGGTIKISGAGTKVTATGGDHGAGIGGGEICDGGDTEITGGAYVVATGGDRASGIGGGCGDDPDNAWHGLYGEYGCGGTVTITGEGTYAKAIAGNHAAGIGGGYIRSRGADVTIGNGATVEAKAGNVEYSAIGGGEASRYDGTLDIIGDTLVRYGSSAGSTMIAHFDERIYGGWNHGYTKLEPCEHSYTETKDWVNDNPDGHQKRCPWCGAAQGELEGHTFDESGSCTVCSYSGTIHYVDANGVDQTLEDGTYKNLKPSEIPEGILDGDWYVVRGTVTYGFRIDATGDVNILLVDGAKLQLPKGIHVPEGAKLTIWSQKGDTGELIAAAEDTNAAIGGNNQESNGTITINGGNITAISGTCAAGIGGGQNGGGGTVSINRGTVTATGGEFAAGIGSGNEGEGGTVDITGGTVTATGGKYASGIGAGDGAPAIEGVSPAGYTGGTINISGVDTKVTATGGECGAGIGGGRSCGGGKVTIIAGTVKATGGANAAGIGNGERGNGNVVNVYGGTVTATGGANAAGIGGKGSTVRITSGHIRATGGTDGSGIGDGDGGVTITLGYEGDDADMSVRASSYGGDMVLERMFRDVAGGDDIFVGSYSRSEASQFAGKTLVPANTHTVTVLDTEHGTVTASRKLAAPGAEVTLSAVPDEGYELAGVAVADADGNGMEVSEGLTFSMPASDVTVEAAFRGEGGPDLSGIEYYMSLSLDERIAVNLYVNNLPEGTDPADYAVKYWVTGDESGAAEKHPTETGTNFFRLADFAAKEMAVPVHVRVYYQGTLIKSADYSVRDYCDRRIEESNDAKLVALCQAVLDYGAYAQKHFDYNTDDLANANHSEGTEERVAAATVPADFAASSSGSVSALKSMSASVALDSQAVISFYLTPAEADFDMSIPSVYVDGNSVREGRPAVALSDGATVASTVLEDGRLLVQIAGIAPKHYDHAFRVEVTHGRERKIVYYSVLSYARSKQGVTKKNLGSTCKALYNYHLAAKNYLG